MKKLALKIVGRRGKDHMKEQVWDMFDKQCEMIDWINKHETTHPDQQEDKEPCLGKCGSTCCDHIAHAYKKVRFHELMHKAICSNCTARKKCVKHACKGCGAKKDKKCNCKINYHQVERAVKDVEQTVSWVCTECIAKDKRIKELEEKIGDEGDMKRGSYYIIDKKVLNDKDKRIKELEAGFGKIIEKYEGMTGNADKRDYHSAVRAGIRLGYGDMVEIARRALGL